jgi:hypothetical protein
MKSEDKSYIIHKNHLGFIRLCCKYIEQNKEYCKKYKIPFNWDTCYNCENMQKHKTKADI